MLNKDGVFYNYSQHGRNSTWEQNLWDIQDDIKHYKYEQNQFGPS